MAKGVPMHQIAQNMLIARRTERSVKIVAIVIATIGIVVALWMKPNVVSFWEFTKEDIVRLFTQLIVIALFIERSLEVLLTPWRDVEAEKMREQVKDAQQGAQAAQAGPAEVSRLSWKWRKRSSVKIAERTYEKR